MIQRLRNRQIDETIQAALDSLPEQERQAIDDCVADLVGTMGDERGANGIKRARELVFALAMSDCQQV